MKILNQVRIETLPLPPRERRALWLRPFLGSYLVVFLAYMAMYIIRKNFNVAQNELIEQYGFNKTDLGKIGFWFSLTYGVGKTAVGYLGDRRNTKNMISILLICAALSMFAFAGLTGSLTGMIFFFALNGFFQSAGGPLSYSTITKWTVHTNRGRFLGLWNISHNLGGALAAVVASFGAEYVFDGDVRGMFIFPAFVALIIGIGGLFVGSDSPEAYGLGKAEEIFEETFSEQDIELQETHLSQWQIIQKYILKNPYIWGLFMANIFLYIVRIGVDQWGVVYAREVLGHSKEVATSGFTLFELGALSGALLWGYLSDLTKSRSSMISMIAMLLIFTALNIYQKASDPTTYRISMFVLGFLIFGPQLLIGVSGVFFVPKQAVSVTDGMKGTFGYLLGDSFAKLGMGMMADNKTVMGLSGWSGTFIAMYMAALFCLICLAFVAIGEEKRIRKQVGRGKN